MKVTSINRKFSMEPENEEPPGKKETVKKNKLRALINLDHSPLAKLYASRWATLILTWWIILATIGCIWLYQALTARFYAEKVVMVPGIGVRTAKAAEVEEVVWPDIGDCEQYRPIVEKYFGKLTDEALFVAKNESGCIADRVSNPNSDGTKDYCLFQINKEPLTAQSLDVCVRRAFEKYRDGRIGVKNWSAFYAVCDVNAQPKYPKTIKNCS